MEAKFKVTYDSGWEGLDEVQGYYSNLQRLVST